MLNLMLTLTISLILVPNLSPNPVAKPDPNLNSTPDAILQDAISPTAEQQRHLADGYVAMTERVHAIFAARRRQLQSLFVSQLPDSRLLWSRAAGTQALSQSLSFEVRGRARQVGAMLHLEHMQ